ncbi:MAG: ABC transporter ATP-binding protein, partial [Lachnospiraceae bacterium]|nr:ABC transporter ATP-binding protein [Lachnospiraceae bacterium]
SIGQALITRPGLVIADEPVSALDVTIQAQILELIKNLQRDLGTAFLFISHDINVIYQVSDRIMVMRNGKILEIGETLELFHSPRDPYTKELLR